MPDLPEGPRLSGHVWLDLVSAYDDDAPDLWQTGFSAALPRFTDVNGFTAVFDDETDVLDVDGTNLLGSGALLIHLLATRVAALEGIDRTDVLVWAREQLDS